MHCSCVTRDEFWSRICNSNYFLMPIILAIVKERCYEYFCSKKKKQPDVLLLTCFLEIRNSNVTVRHWECVFQWYGKVWLRNGIKKKKKYAVQLTPVSGSGKRFAIWIWIWLTAALADRNKLEAKIVKRGGKKTLIQTLCKLESTSSLFCASAVFFALSVPSFPCSPLLFLPPVSPPLV